MIDFTKIDKKLDIDLPSNFYKWQEHVTYIEKLKITFKFTILIKLCFSNINIIIF